MHMSTQAFNDRQAIATYAERTAMLVPGYRDMQRMAMVLLAERSPADARVLVLGAGGGLELEMFAQANPAWRLDAIDPSAEMLELARRRLEPHRQRVRLVQGYIGDAPPGPFDAACSLLTLHFIGLEERRRTLGEVRGRLRPGAPFVSAHYSFSQREPERRRWLSRHAAFALSSGVAPFDVERMQSAIGSHLYILSPEEDEALLRDAGFTEVESFYSGFGFRGWVASAKYLS